jgi:hypothetical protein
MKDDLSLDEISDLFSPSFRNVKISQPELANRNIVTETIINIFNDLFPDYNTYNFKNITHMAIVNKELEVGSITVEDSKSIIKTLEENLSNKTESNFNVIILRKLGVTTCVIISSHSNLFVEDKAKVIANIDYAKELDALRTKLGGL